MLDVNTRCLDPVYTSIKKIEFVGPVGKWNLIDWLDNIQDGASITVEVKDTAVVNQHHTIFTATVTHE